MRTLAALLAPALLAAAPRGRGDDVPTTAGTGALLERFAPLVLLAPDERARPANVEWYLARARFEPRASSMTQAALLGDRAAGPAAHVPRLRPSAAARAGSPDPHDWVTYAHAYGASGGGLVLQYWFFYPFNDGRLLHALLDHEGDWEHVSVLVGADGAPRGAWYAHHRDCAPGRWYPWASLAREGDHPVVLSALGTHASYAAPADVPWYDRACRTRDPARAPALGCSAWRTWLATSGGIVDTGPRDEPRPAARFIAWPGAWGASRDAPPGPAFQAGWCAHGAPGCR